MRFGMSSFIAIGGKDSLGAAQCQLAIGPTDETKGLYK
jgi:hypothetical protein